MRYPAALVALVLAPMPAAAGGPTMDLALIDQAVAKFAGASQGTAGGARTPVDRRLRLARCEEPLQLAWFGGRRLSVLVECPHPSWKLHVAIAGPDKPVGGASADAVRRGDGVTILVEGSGFSLSRQGEALEGGAAGEWIRVRPAGESRGVLRARVVEAGRVAVALP